MRNDNGFMVVMMKDGKLVDVDCRELGYCSKGKWYFEYYCDSDYWRELKERTLKVCFYECVCCGKGDKLSMHHKNYNNLWREVPIKDVVILCDRCHDWVYKKRYGLVGNKGVW